MRLPELQPVRTPAEGWKLVARLEKMGAYIDQESANLRRGLAAGKVATADEIRRVLGQLDDLLGKPDDKWPLRAPAAAAHPDWPAPERLAFSRAVDAAIAAAIRPAFERQRALLRWEILPRARDEAHAGILNVAGGAACYAQADQGSHVARVAGGGDPPHRARRAGAHPRRDGAHREGGVRQRHAARPAATAARRSGGVLPRRAATSRRRRARRWRARTPRSRGFSGGGRARRAWSSASTPSRRRTRRSPTTDRPPSTVRGPAAYYVNTYKPETRARYEVEALAFHESVPGHHIQIAIAQELTGLPEFRKHAGVTAFVEGWGLYAEGLADELGLYKGARERLGRLNFDAWRASRLVVDTGIHSMGWSRSKAIAFFEENAILAKDNIVNEVDRYIAWPGQALAYKVGEREIRTLRARRRAAAGRAKFDVKAFHDLLLGGGAVSLPVLRERIDEWIVGGAAR